MHVWWYGESGEKKGGTRETSRQQQQQHGFMSQRYGQPSTTKAAKQTLDNWQDGGGTWSKWPNLREVSLGEVKGAGPRRLRFQHYNAGVIQKGRTNLILPYVNEGKAIEKSIRVTIIRLTINFLTSSLTSVQGQCNERIPAGCVSAHRSPPSWSLSSFDSSFKWSLTRSTTMLETRNNVSWNCYYDATIGSGQELWEMGRVAGGWEKLSQKTERKGEKKLGMRKKVWKKR